MRIGQLSEATGVPTRMLRYYEEQRLLSSDRRPNGYREYSDETVDRVLQIRGLIDAGVPTAIIEQLSPCLNPSSDIVLHDDCPELVELLERQRDQMTDRIACLTRNRDSISDYVSTIRLGLASRG